MESKAGGVPRLPAKDVARNESVSITVLSAFVTNIVDNRDNYKNL